MQSKLWRWVILPIFMAALLVGGCTPEQTALTSSQNPSAAETTSPNDRTSTPTNPVNNPQFSNLPRLEGKATVVITVNGSPITIEVDGTNAPISAGNFVDLVNRGVYNGLVFHRVIRDPQPFVAQGGDPQSKDPKVPAQALGTGSFIDPATKQPRYIPLEIKPKGADSPIYSKTFSSAGVSKPPELKHTRGSVAMARSQFPDSASSQFYISLADLPFLDGDYAVFGYVTKGMEAVDKIQQGDRIESATVTQGLEGLKNGGK